MSLDCLLGMPLQEAVSKLEQKKLFVELSFALPPDGRKEGALRVVRVREEGETVGLTVSYFKERDS